MATFSSGIVGTAQIGDGSVTTAKLADNAVTVGKLLPDAIAQKFIVNGTTDITTTSTSFVTMTGMSQAITTTGGAVLVIFSGSFVYVGGTDQAQYRLVRDTTELVKGKQQTGTTYEQGPFVYTETPAAGTYTYAVEWRVVTNGTNTNNASTEYMHRTMVVMELL